MFETTFFNMLSNQRDLLKYTQGMKSNMSYGDTFSVHKTKIVGDGFVEEFAGTIEDRMKGLSWLPAFNPANGTSLIL